MRISDWSSDVCSSDLDLSVSLATSVLWALTLGYLVLVRAAFQAHRKAHIGEGTRPTRDEVKEEIRAHGGGTLSWIDRKSVVWGKSVSVRVDLVGRRIIKKKK